MATTHQEARSGSPPRRVPLLVLTIGFWAGAYFQQFVEYDNTRSRLYTSAALVEHGTFNLDAYKDATIDISRAPDGHYYSNKGIGLLLLAAPVHWALRRLTPLGNHEVLNLPETYFLRLITITLPFAVSMLLVYLLAGRLGASTRQSLFVCLAYGIGTPAWQHGMMFSGHILTATFTLGSLYLLVRLKARPAPSAGIHSLLMAAGAGLLTGWATLTDYPAVILTALLSLYLLSLKRPWPQTVVYFVGGGLMAGLLMWYNAAHFGGPFTLSYGHHELEMFAEGTDQGLMGITLPKPWSFVQLTLLPARGLLAISPVLVLMLPGTIALWRRPELRREWWLLVLAVGIFLLWTSGYFGWHSGWAYGSRYLTPVLPLAALLLALAPRFGWLGWTLLGVSVVQNLLAVAGCPFPPERILNPLVELVLPLMDHGYWALHLGLFLGLQGWWAMLLFAAVLGGLLTLALRQTTDAESPVVTIPAKPWRWVAGAWLAAVLLMLAFVRSDPTLVHNRRAQLLRDLYDVSGNPAIRNAAIEEQYEARLLGR